jgi:hypothetical protein
MSVFKGESSVNELLLRFLIGGTFVSFFAVFGDLFRPKSFAGLFGAAPSVALATLSLAFVQHGGKYVSIEGRSMLLGALALFVYCQVVAWLLMRRQVHTLVATIAAVLPWLVVALGLWVVFFSRSAAA